MINIQSFLRGIRAMTCNHKPAGWTVLFGRCGFWCDLWTPTWHEGRGPYVTVGLGLVCIMRGY